MQKLASGRKAKRKACAPDEEVELALALRALGWGHKRIAKKLDRPTQTVWNWINGRTRAGVGSQLD